MGSPMRAVQILSFVMLLPFAQISSAASLEFLHPREGGKANSSFQSVFKVLDAPLDKDVTVTVTVRDKETGNESFSNTFEYLPGKKAQTFIERVDAIVYGATKETTLTITVRDKATGNELVSDTVSFTMRDK